MKKSTIIIILCFVLGIAVLTVGFILLTDNNISSALFPGTTTTTTRDDGEEDPEYEPMNFFDVDVSQYITLGQYKGIELEVERLEVSQEEIDEQIRVLLAQEGEFTKIREGSITEGAIFSFDYTGYYKNADGTRGDAFDNGADTDQLAYIDGTTLVTINDDSTGSFIDGFAQGILGATVGSTFSIDVTFPTNYGNSLAGQNVEFEIKVNYIAETNYTDGWVKEYTSGTYTTAEEFEQYLRDSINADIKDSNIESLWLKIVENSTILQIPQQQFDYLRNSMIEEVEGYVTYSYYYFGEQLDYLGVIKQLGFEDEAEFEEYIEEYANSYIKSELVLYAVMQVEDITVTDEEYQLFLDTLVESTGMTAESVVSYYGEENIRNTVLFQNLDIFIYNENAFVVKDGK